jgi:hypothetical protein
MGSVPSPLSSGAFLTQPLLQAFVFQGCWVGVAIPAFSSWLVYLQFCKGLPLPSSQCSGHPTPFATCLLLLLLFSLVISLFLP